MKKTTVLLIILSFILISCNKKITERIKELESLNEILLDSINELNIPNVNSARIFGIFDKGRYVKNDTATIWFYFYEDKIISEYSIYQSNADLKKEKLIYKNLNKSMFEYKVLVESEKEKRVRLIAEFKFKNGNSIQIPVNVGINPGK